jgi:hypothetical protein
LRDLYIFYRCWKYLKRSKYIFIDGRSLERYGIFPSGDNFSLEMYTYTVSMNLYI